MMPTSHFHRFPDLPYDIRRQIYAIATPPRLVYIKEGFPISDEWIEKWETRDYDWMSGKGLSYAQFEDELKGGPLRCKLKLHPDLVYFAHHWRNQLPWSTIHRQTQLEDYGFTSKQPKYQPWTPTADTPEIPIHWLTSRPELAHELARESWLHSQAPIPVFLHVCVESRQALIRWGYELAFRTRSYGPRTWFHFGRDILQVPKMETDHLENEASAKILSGCSWDIGQFDPACLQRVRRLVLSTCAPPNDDAAEFVGVISLFPNLKDLFLEEWRAEELATWFNEGDARLNAWSVNHSDQAEDALHREPLSFVPSEHIDAVISTSWVDTFSDSGPYFGPYHARPDVQITPFPKIVGLSIQRDRELDAQRVARGLAARINVSGNRHWRLPAIKYIHTCPESLCQRLIRNRHQFWQAYVQLKEARNRGSDVERADMSTLEFHLGFRFEEIRDECAIQLQNWVHWSGLPIADANRIFREAMHAPNGPTGWYFDADIPEPSLQPFKWE
ncbi:hypothetical protein NM208_g618 [Fusarium decemcellulare]|uniref:Uncharacterized protein n=1 Tax=Fusarium decemcellulare TaxID=57161 RepID=A0ACC1SZ50_9HYPO|nr:hypothetical protein NM208_g618 [Fusarium decemcellulare]